ncbi:MmgE/PrpD family protein [Orbus sasakiae]|uniref:MmgE/PrpD family protein n=1 Tax=Orbus sasakiae TaxID=1078475 RepID=A0ABP9N1Z4_9GAMM
MTDLNQLSLTDHLIKKILLSQPLHNKAAKDAAIQGIVDYFASSLQARHHTDCQKLWQWIQSEGGTANSWLVGQSQHATARQAALYNGLQAHVLDYDDVHADVRGHPSAVILSALLASLQSADLPTDRFLSAYIIGIELMAHLGKAVGTEHYQKGWHNTATLGGIAATAAICYYHNYAFIKDALALATTQACGLRLVFGSAIKPLHAGMAAQIAIQSCQWAQAGLTADCDFLDEKSGFLAVYGQGNHALNLDRWGEPWRIVKPGLWFKQYSYCSAASYVADATQLILKQHQFSLTQIDDIKIIFSARGDEALIYQSVTHHSQGRFSAEYIVASLLLGRPLTFDSFNNDPIDEPLNIMMAKVRREYDHKTTQRYATVLIQLKNGQQLSQQIVYPKGSPNNSYSKIELKQKFFNSILDKQAAQYAYDLLMKFTEQTNINSIIHPLSDLFIRHKIS